jgi:hypothetical protein
MGTFSEETRNLRMAVAGDFEFENEAHPSWQTRSFDSPWRICISSSCRNSGAGASGANAAG